jgi:micrococcal nuclease
MIAGSTRTETDVCRITLIPVAVYEKIKEQIVPGNRQRMVLAKPFSVVVISLFIPSLLLAAEFSGHVVGIIDGDTISVMHGSRTQTIRLNGVDCPDKRQAFGQHAKQFTSKLSFGKDVTVKTFGHDKQGAILGDVILPNGQVLNHELVKAGLAWWYEKCSNDTILRDLQEEARQAKRLVGIPRSRRTMGLAALTRAIPERHTVRLGI